MLTFALIMVFILGLMIGYVSKKFVDNIETVGNLRIDNSDPDDGPYLFLELETNPESIKRKKYITLKVVAKNYISQK